MSLEHRTTLAKGRILVRGSINIDEYFVVPRIVASGETIASTRCYRRPGGKGANQAVAIAKCQGKVDFSGFIGEEDEPLLLDTLKYFGVGTDYVKKSGDVSVIGMGPGVASGRAIIQVSSETHDNSIITHSGANACTDLSLLDNGPDKLSRWGYVLLQNEIPLKSTRAWVSAAHQAGKIVIFNPSPIMADDDIRSFHWDKVTWLITNEGEAQCLLKALLPETRFTDAKDIIRSLKSSIFFRSTSIVITLGGKGLIANFDGEEIQCKSGNLLHDVKDTTGAGDCFTGFFAALCARDDKPLNKDHVEAYLNIASQAATMCVEEEGAMDSMPTLAELKIRLEESSGRYSTFRQFI